MSECIHIHHRVVPKIPMYVLAPRDDGGYGNTIEERMVMAKRLSMIYWFLLVFIMMSSVDVSLAFNRKTRCQILKDAIFLSPKAIKTYLLQNFNDVHDGVHFVDRTTRAGRGRDLKNTSYYARAYYQNLVKNIKANKMNDYNTINGFGLLACFIAESISPDNYRTTSSLVLDRFEYDGYQKINNVNDSITRLVNTYGKKYKGKEDRASTGLLYQVAVNEIIDHWVSAWIAGGKNPGKFRPDGFVLARKKNMVLEFAAFR